MKQSFALGLLGLIFFFFFLPKLAFSQKDSVVIDSTKIFVESHPQDAQTPTMSFISKNGNHQVGIGGFARMKASYDAQTAEGKKNWTKLTLLSRQ